MGPARDSAALVALLRLDRRPWREYVEPVENAGSATPVLEQELARTTRERTGSPGTQLTLGDERAPRTGSAPADPAPTRDRAEALLDRAEAQIRDWQREGLQLVTVLDARYPQNLRTVWDRPPLLFVAGTLRPEDARSVAVVGARRATGAGVATAARLAEHLVGSGYAVVSGLASGIDAAAHQAALEAGGRTVAVVGTGLRHCYPAENAALQRRITAEGAVVSQFWPETPPARENFPMRNAVMSGLALGTVVVEASFRSGARLQSRLALAHGRPVFLVRSLLAQPWALDLAERPGVHVVDEPDTITQTIERLYATDDLVE